MKRLLALLLCVFGSLATPLHAEVELSFDFYHDQLSPMGEWAEVNGYGYVWHPNGVDEDWAPYTDGYWSYTDAGWTWVSYEDWGAICYHYGRWVDIEGFGWCWVPGYEWGPAWVSWRNSDEYIGWAPLPPECDWEPDRGVSVWVDTSYDIGPRYYSFCRVRDFGAPVIRHVCLPRIRNFEICFSTVNCTNITYNRDYGCVFNGGFDYDYIRARCDRTVPTLKLVQNTTNIFVTNNTRNVFVNSQRGNTLVVAAPRVAVNAKQYTRKPAVRRTFDRGAVTRGWNGVDKPEVRDRLVSKMRAETKGLTPENTKARPVKQEALAVVPKEAKPDAPTAGMKRLPAERGNRETARDGATERMTPAERAGRIEKMQPNGRGETAEAPQEGDAAKNKGRNPVAGADGRNGGLRKRPDREGADPAELERPAVGGLPEAGAPGAGKGRARDLKAERMITPQDPANQNPDRVTERENRGNEKPEKPNRAAELRDAQENARRQAQENAENAARVRQENAAQEKTARDAADRAQRQREVNENAGRAAEMKRQAQENAGRENAAREQAAEAAAARRAQMEAAQARQNRAGDQAEAAQRQAAQQAENARRAAAAQQNENARRQTMERQNEARQQQAQRQAEAQRENAAAQQNEARQRAAEAMRERAAQAQQHQQAEMARSRAAENQQRAAAAAQAQAQARAEAQQNAHQQQQRAAAAAAAQAAARQQSQGRSQDDSDDKKKRR